jgi:uncharacterized membrane protein YccF (DUF307 family)
MTKGQRLCEGGEMMRFFGNVLWLIFGGLVNAIIWLVAGLLCCITILGIPFGVQCLKISGFVLWPFGRDVTPGGCGVMGAIGNVIWILICGITLCVLHLVFGVLLCVTVVGIPFGIQHFKLAKLSLIPFGADIHRV